MLTGVNHMFVTVPAPLEICPTAIPETKYAQTFVKWYTLFWGKDRGYYLLCIGGYWELESL